MGHLTEGVLRRYLDEPAAVTDTDRAHLGVCPRCTRSLAEAAADRDAVMTAFGQQPGRDGGRRSGPEGARGPDVEGAWFALRSRLDGMDSTLPVARRRRRWARHPVAAGVAAAALLIGGTAAAAAADWLPIFRTQDVAPVAVSIKDASALTSLSAVSSLADYGVVSGASDANPVPVADAAAATARTGLTAPVVSTFPTGVTGTPAYSVIDQKTVSFMFSAAKAEKTAADRGVSLPAMPAGLDGTTVRIVGGPGIILTWSKAGAVPTMLVARSTAITASTQGIALPVVRDYLLSIPGIPADLAAQLRTVTGDGTTLPIPVVEGRTTSSRADVGGVTGTVLEAKGGAGSAVVWVRGGLLQTVAGSLSTGEVLEVARALG